MDTQHGSGKPVPPSESDSAVRRAEPMPGRAAVKSGSCQGLQLKKKNQGPPLWVDHCLRVSVSLQSFVYNLRMCSLNTEQHLGSISRVWTCFTEELQCSLCFFFFLAVHCWHIILVLFRICKYFKH